MIEFFPTNHCATRVPKNQQPRTTNSLCPYCGESVELIIDEDGGSRQLYVEDCEVCCQPWQVRVTSDAEGEWAVELKREDE